MTLDVDITDRDILIGERCDCRACPAALALMRAADRAFAARALYLRVCVTRFYCTVSDSRLSEPWMVRAETPPALVVWLDAFDFGDPVTPSTHLLTFKTVSQRPWDNRI